MEAISFDFFAIIFRLMTPSLLHIFFSRMAFSLEFNNEPPSFSSDLISAS